MRTDDGAHFLDLMPGTRDYKTGFHIIIIDFHNINCYNIPIKSLFYRWIDD